MSVGGGEGDVAQFSFVVLGWCVGDRVVCEAAVVCAELCLAKAWCPDLGRGGWRYADWYLVWGEWDWVGWLGVGLLVCGGGWVFG